MSESRDAILKDRFLHPGETSYEDMCRRAAKAWGTDSQHEKLVYEMLVSRKALANTPALANAGRPVQMGSACYVLPVNDSLVDGESSIMQTAKDAAAVHKSGGGTGFSFSRIRPKGSIVSSTGRPAPGAVNVLKLYSVVMKLVTQAGMRPGANMGILDVNHPDIMDFITSKAVEGDIHNFNISVAMTDEFMQKVTMGTLTYDQQQVWDAIVYGAWKNGEPGLFFIDTTNDAALHDEYIESTNPCGEVPLRPYEACVLGSVNLAAHYSPETNHLDVVALRDTVFTLVEMLDNVIERQDYPIPEIEREQKRYRKIGVGVMGYADLLCLRGLRYGSREALDCARFAMSAIQEFSYEASEELGRQRGMYYGWTPGMPIRQNLNCQVIAPTGTISRLAECSFGIEPHFDVDEHGNYLSFVVGGMFTDHNPFYDSPVFTPASKVTLAEHIETQAAFQEFTDQAVSKTINCPNSTTLEEIESAYIGAWGLGCKGITILREGSREEVVIGVAEEGDCVGGVCPV